MKIDTLIRAKWVLPINPTKVEALQNHAIAINEGKILDILPSQNSSSKYQPIEIIDRPQSIVLPGLINTHAHTGMTLMRGRADDQPLLKWLQESIWPIESTFASKEEFCHDGAFLAAAEMIRGGVTCFSDMYMFPDGGAKVALRTGLRAVIGMVIIGFPSGYAKTIDEYIDNGHKVMDKYKDEQTLHFAYAPHAPYTVPTDAWLRIKQLSEQHDIPIHTHLHETKDECTSSLILDRKNPACHTSDNPCHPLQDFEMKGLLSSKLVAAHMVYLTDDEIRLCAERGVNIAHCPTSNAKLASGFCPIPKLLKAGVNVALGTDSAVSNNSLDILAEMKMAALTAKNIALDATVVPAAEAVKMATINGAKALGIDDVTGSLQIGKSADLICIDVETNVGNSPAFDPFSAVVYASSRSDITDVMVKGKLLLKEKKYQTFDESDVLRRVEYWRDQINDQFPNKYVGGSI